MVHSAADQAVRTISIACIRYARPRCISLQMPLSDLGNFLRSSEIIMQQEGHSICLSINSRKHYRRSIARSTAPPPARWGHSWEMKHYKGTLVDQNRWDLHNSNHGYADQGTEPRR